MVVASVNLVEGRGLPTAMGDPTRVRGFPVKVTWPPAWAERESVGIFGCMVAQPSANSGREPARAIRIFLEIMEIPPWLRGWKQKVTSPYIWRERRYGRSYPIILLDAGSRQQLLGFERLAL
jgi:hypothetical protein